MVQLMRPSKQNNTGITLIEIIVVVVIVVMVTAAVAPLIRTTYVAWITSDRRVEIVETGRVGMSKMVRELRLAHDLYSATDPLYIDYYPQWATTTVYRFNYDASNGDFEYGVFASPTFTPYSLAAPVDTFAYTTYTRRLVEGVNRARRINAYRFVYSVSDERRILPDARPELNPITFRSHAHLRMSREGYFFAKSWDFASESYRFRRNQGQRFCVRAFCDRVDRDAIVTRQLAFVVAPPVPNLTLVYFATGDYFATCCVITNNAATPNYCPLNANPNTNVAITLSDGTEWTIMKDIIIITN